MMDDTEATRIALRRETHALKEAAQLLAEKIRGFDEEAADAVRRAGFPLFEAWTILCVPPEEDDDDHD